MTPLLDEERPDCDAKGMARRIRIQCQRYDISFEKLAFAIGVKVLRVEVLASGQQRFCPDPTQMAHLATALRCNPRYLLTGKVA